MSATSPRVRIQRAIAGAIALLTLWAISAQTAVVAAAEKVDSESTKLNLPVAEAAKKAPEIQNGSTSGAAWRMILGLLFVLGVIFVVHKMLKSYNGSNRGGVAMAGAAGGAVEVLATTPLSPSRTLHLVRMGQEILLLGATDQSISRLGTVEAGKLGQVQTGSEGSTFSTNLTHAMTAPLAPRSGPEPGFLRRVVRNLQMMTAR